MICEPSPLIRGGMIASLTATLRSRLRLALTLLGLKTLAQRDQSFQRA